MSQGTGWVPKFGANGVDYFNIEHFLRDAWWGGGYEGGEHSVDCITAETDGNGVDVVLEMSGSEAALHQGLAAPIEYRNLVDPDGTTPCGVLLIWTTRNGA